MSAVGTGCSTSATFAASEPGYSGNFTGTVANTSIVTLAQATTSGTFTVNAVTTTNGGLSTTITVKDSHGTSVTENVAIATCLP
ncbi:MAG: hypothetical protein ACLQPV_08640 [Vulcanimicrobiaceae bacterium]